MDSSTTLARAQAASAVYDAVLAGFFAFPVVAALYLDVGLRYVHGALGAIGWFPPFEPFHLLFVNMFGGFTLMWSTLRIVRRSDAGLALCDALLRCYFALLMLTYALVWGAPAIMGAFVASELIWGSVLLGMVRSARRNAQSARKVADRIEVPRRSLG